MKNMMQTVLATGMIFLYAFSFGQSTETGTPITPDTKPISTTHLDFFINGVATNLYYGASNTALADFKKPALGVQVGVSCQRAYSRTFSTVTELYFIMKGGQLKENNPLTDQESIIRLYTIEMPVMARVKLGQFNLIAGPSIAYTFHGTQKSNGLRDDLSFNNEAGGIKHWDAGIQVGGGYSFVVNQKRVSLDIRYCHGLTNISYDKEMYNRCVLVSLHIAKK
jgi:hypothetical protein